jgi:hypothetical protein
VLPGDYGTNPALAAGIPGMNFPNDAFTSGLPGGYINDGAANMEFGTGLDDRTGRCNCPLDEDENQWQVVANFTKTLGNHTVKVGADIRRAHNLRIPSDNHRSGEIYFNGANTEGPTGGGMGLATFLLGNVSEYKRYVSSSTDARELQWRHFYYIQDTWRAGKKLTLNYGIRADIINPQTINAAGNAGYFDLATGNMDVVGVGGVPLNGGIKNTINWAPRLGATYQVNEKTVVRLGYGRSFDIGVFGSTFGHSVTQNLPVLARQDVTPPSNFKSVFNLGQGPPAPTFPAVSANGTFKAPGDVTPSILPPTQRLPRIDAYNLTIQRELTSDISAEIGYVGNKGTHVFFGDGPDVGLGTATLQGFAQGIPQNLRQPYFAGPVATPMGTFGAPYGITAYMRYLCNCGDNNYNSLQAKLTKRFSKGYSLLATYTLQGIKNNDGSQAFVDRPVGYGTPDWARTHLFTLAATVELPFGKGKAIGGDVSQGLDYVIGGWQLNTTAFVYSGRHLNVDYRNASQDRDVGPNRPNVIGDITSGGGTQDRWFNATPIGSTGSAFSRPDVGTFGNMPRGALIGPGYWNVDASLFKRFKFTERTNLELRVEMTNVFNHVALGDPDTTLGVPGNDNTNAGRITSTAALWQARNVQFAVRLQF